MAQAAKKWQLWILFLKPALRQYISLSVNERIHNLRCVVGPENGLQLVINVEQYENIPDMANNIGVAVSSQLTVVD